MNCPETFFSVKINQNLANTKPRRVKKLPARYLCTFNDASCLHACKPGIAWVKDLMSMLANSKINTKFVPENQHSTQNAKRSTRPFRTITHRTSSHRRRPYRFI